MSCKALFFVCLLTNTPLKNLGVRHWKLVILKTLNSKTYQKQPLKKLKIVLNL